MEVEYVGKRAHLFHLLQQHPEWTLQQYADAVGCSQSMVCTWRQRFREAQAQGTLDASIFFSRSRAPHHHPPRIDTEVKERVLSIRQSPPEPLQRTPGPWLSCITCNAMKPCRQKQPTCLVRHAPSGASWMLREPLSATLLASVLLVCQELHWKKCNSTLKMFPPFLLICMILMPARQHVIEVCNAGRRWHLSPPARSSS
ncbi:helix-turn-helix domain-containing protein [Ktedonobacter robiniae]|uniref:helix-turn-helix domain-containing protein n=1 Tax=Ktedonobacter robiniae TaxID=2778365 RepID=UPI001F20438E|nr:helix-turn-helix domain-containing protein [Ktedonobacter robiniae]